jgi:hypothetical protein
VTIQWRRCTYTRAAGPKTKQRSVVVPASRRRRNLTSLFAGLWLVSFSFGFLPVKCQHLGFVESGDDRWRL